MVAPPLTEGERRTGVALGLVATVAFVALSGGTPLFLFVGLVMGIGLTLASARRTRVGAASLAFVTTFGPWGFAAVFGAPYAIYAFWLLARASKVAGVTSPAPTGGTRAARRGGGRAT